MRERALSFGASGNLVGILCEPEPAARRTGAPAVLLWNVGIHHRIGPFRIWVELARRLAEVGFASLRFDLAGQGDSEPRRGVVEGNPALADVQEAMALLEKRLGVRTFAPIAFCSGVDALHPLGLQDPRVVAMGYIEGYAYRTRGFWMRYPLRYLNRQRWEKKLQEVAARYGVRRAGGAGDGIALDPVQQEVNLGLNVFSREMPTQEQFARDVETLTGRGVELLFQFFGGGNTVNHRGQLAEMLGKRQLGDRIREYFDGGADHILYRLGDRERALDHICAWLSEKFPAKAAAPLDARAL